LPKGEIFQNLLLGSEVSKKTTEKTIIIQFFRSWITFELAFYLVSFWLLIV